MEIIKPNSEYDIIYLSKVYQAFVMFEIKSIEIDPTFHKEDNKKTLK